MKTRVLLSLIVLLWVASCNPYIVTPTPTPTASTAATLATHTVTPTPTATVTVTPFPTLAGHKASPVSTPKK